MRSNPNEFTLIDGSVINFVTHTGSAISIVSGDKSVWLSHDSGDANYKIGSTHVAILPGHEVCIARVSSAQAVGDFAAGAKNITTGQWLTSGSTALFDNLFPKPFACYKKSPVIRAAMWASVIGFFVALVLVYIYPLIGVENPYEFQGKMEVAMGLSVLGYVVSRFCMSIHRNIYLMAMKKSLVEVIKSATVKVMNDNAQG